MATLEKVTLAFKPAPLCSIEALEIDATISESHQSSADVTEHPVEEGSNISDHRRKKPDTLTLECLISNTPISREGLLSRLVTFPGRAVQFLDNVSKNGIDALVSEVPDTSLAAYEALQALFEAKKPLTVVTNLRTYRNLLVTSLSVPKDNKTGDALRFTVSFKEVRIVKLKLTTIKVQRPKQVVKKGAQPTKDATKDTKSKSLLKQGADTKVGNGLMKALGLRK